MSMDAINSINRKIEETRFEIESIMESGDRLSDIAKFMLEETNRRLDKLNNEKTHILEAQAKEQLSLRLYGESVEHGKISNRILISVLSGFQEMIESIATFSEGSIATRGKFTDKAKIATDFKVTGVFAGSFGVTLEKDCQQMELTENSTETGAVVQNLFNILENSEDSEKLIFQILPYGNRTIAHYKKWLKELKTEGINIEMKWINDSAEMRCYDIQHKKIDNIIYILDSIENISNEEVMKKGILTGINIRQNTFELNTDEGIIKGTSKLETLIEASPMLGDELTVYLIKSSLQRQNFESKVTWYLEKIM